MTSHTTCAICGLYKKEKAYNFQSWLTFLRVRGKTLQQSELGTGDMAHPSCVSGLRDKYNALSEKRGLQVPGDVV